MATLNPIDPSIPSMNIYLVLIVFVFTFIVEGAGLWYSFLLFKKRLKFSHSLGLAFILNLVTFFFGNYILLPLLFRI